ncbi:MAG: hypothetical protein ACKO96_21530, partial [Flammeovirgaceae bacterium]
VLVQARRCFHSGEQRCAKLYVLFSQSDSELCAQTYLQSLKLFLRLKMNPGPAYGSAPMHRPMAKR